ncbi:MAG: DUF1778 domain-containing protein [Candidatus Melainabacteria bacterium]|nr:DUF1778 domain-containing protein [Candidatus Melainabacteria bacterium]
MAISKKKSNDADRLAMRLPSELKKQVERAAALRGETVSGWAKPILAEAAARQLREHDLIEMSHADRIAFIEAVLSPPKPAQRAIEAAKRYKKAFGRF